MVACFNELISLILMQVVSGDLVSDIPPGAVAAAHRRQDAAVTAMLCSTPVSGPSESGSSGGKDKAKKPARHNIIGLDPTKQFLLHIAAGETPAYAFTSFMHQLVLFPYEASLISSRR